MKKENAIDIAVVGGGASGLCAAICAARNGVRVTVMEKNQRVGKKILLTGNGRCNLSHNPPELDSYNGDRKKIGKIFAQWGNTEEFFRSIGLFTSADSEGRVYPLSNSATSVLDALRLECERLGVGFLCGFDVEKITFENNYFSLNGKTETILAKRVIIAAGGFSAPETGSNGSGSRLLKMFGHKCSVPLPSLCPIKVDSGLVGSLKGLRIHARVTLSTDREYTECGEVQFTENSLSGICAFNVSRYAATALEHRITANISLNLLPEKSHSEIVEMLYDIRRTRSNCTLEDMLSGVFNKRIGVYILKNSVDYPLSFSVAGLTDNDIEKTAKRIEKLEFPVSGVSSWKNSQVTAGGIKTDEFSDGMESLLKKGLYACGEVLDVDGICGGYNLEWAWASGGVAGENSAKSLKKEV